ncbi:MAG: hypothetical protein IOD12_11660 [Silvanigrellales bacterium]|nr:hypothetical protein [Silvanigrellales bacterium]
MKLSFASATLVTAACFVSSAASARVAEFPKCFSRTYSQAHLDAHLGQKVKSVSLKLNRVGDRRNAELDVRITRAPSAPFVAYTRCSLTDDPSPLLNWTCNVLCDGGGYDIFRAEDGNVFLKNRGVSLESECGGGGHSSIPLWLEADAENTLFRLDEVPCE